MWSCHLSSVLLINCECFRKIRRTEPCYKIKKQYHLLFGFAFSLAVLLLRPQISKASCNSLSANFHGKWWLEVDKYLLNLSGKWSVVQPEDNTEHKWGISKRGERENERKGEKSALPKWSNSMEMERGEEPMLEKGSTCKPVGGGGSKEEKRGKSEANLHVPCFSNKELHTQWRADSVFTNNGEGALQIQ